ncbi:MAG: hypothetical protein J2O46_05790 [Nocardioides sp.]|nr:hypothetical protein [Nocardioides sp.]
MTAEVTTYRYIRFALLAVLVGLGVAVVIQTVRGGFETSISAYYYTAAGPVFIGVLTSLGACLVALRGFTDAEETALNVAGVSAPMVAFVPTPKEGVAPDLAGITVAVSAYLAVLGIGYVVVVAVGVRKRLQGEPWPSLWGLIGLAGVAGAWVLGVVWLALDRHSFATHAHALAATFTFLPVAFAVLLNTDWGVRVIAREAHASRTRFDRIYWLLLIIMIAIIVVGGALGILGWDYWLLAVEIAMLTCFFVYWTAQSWDLMDPERDRLTTHALKLGA